MLLAALDLALLVAIGLGWTLLAFRRRAGPLGVAALSPAVGVAALVVWAVVLDRLGVRLVGAGGVATGAVAALSGWALCAFSELRSRGRPDPGPRPSI